MTQRLNIPFEIKALSSREVEGHGSVFGNVDLGDDIVMPGAFKRSLMRHKSAGTLPLMFWMHDPKQVPGVWTEIAEDERGLYVKGELVDTQLGNEVRTLLQKKAVRGLSIGYVPVESDYRNDGVRLLKELDLWEVSVVSLAMNPLATIEAVKTRLSGAGEYVPTQREFERLLRDAGCSRKLAALMAAQFCAGCDPSGTLEDHPRDAEAGDDESKAVLELLNGRIDLIGAAALKR